MPSHQPVLERAYELAGSGCFRTPGEVRAALAAEGYPPSDVFRLEERKTWARIRTVCGDACYGDRSAAMSE